MTLSFLLFTRTRVPHIRMCQAFSMQILSRNSHTPGEYPKGLFTARQLPAARAVNMIAVSLEHPWRLLFTGVHVTPCPALPFPALSFLPFTTCPPLPSPPLLSFEENFDGVLWLPCIHRTPSKGASSFHQSALPRGYTYLWKEALSIFCTLKGFCSLWLQSQQCQGAGLCLTVGPQMWGSQDVSQSDLSSSCVVVGLSSGYPCAF